MVDTLVKQASEVPSTTEIIVLLSGGLDSATCLDFHLEIGRHSSAFFIDYQQPACEQEFQAALNVARHYGVPLLHTTWRGLSHKSVGAVAGRNAFLLIAALLERPSTATVISLGVHSGTAYSDCSPEFISQMQALFDLYTGGSVQVSAPFIDWTKSDIWAYAVRRGVPIHLTYSCEAGGDRPCGECFSCQDRVALHDQA